MISYQNLPQWLKFSLTFPLVFLNGSLIWLLYHSLQPISSIVISACLVTFLLDYPISFLERRGLPRTWAIGLVLVIAIALMGAIGFGLLPIVFRQLEEFVNRLPAWLTAARQQVSNLSTLPIFQNIPIDLTNLTAGLTDRVTQTLQLASRKAIFLSLLALQNIWLGLKVLLVAIVVGQIIDNAIAPRLMSGMTGLNPAVVFISVLTGSQVAGLLGLLLAVPMAGFIKRIADSLKERLR